MKKEDTIKKRKEFNFIFKNGQVFSSKYVSVFVTTGFKNKYKVGFSSGKKVGKAVVRNKVKRRIKEAVYQNRELLKPKTNYIFSAKAGSDKASFEEINKCIIFLLQKIMETEIPKITSTKKTTKNAEKTA